MTQSGHEPDWVRARRLRATGSCRDRHHQRYKCKK